MKISQKKALNVVKNLYPHKEVLFHYKNGNHFTTILSDGTRVRQTTNVDEKSFSYDFSENCDVKITNCCTGVDGKLCEYCHENSGPWGKHADLNLPIFDTWKAGTEMAIGGGNIFEHPDLEFFLSRMKAKGVICNITVNQKHIKENYDTLIKFIRNNFVHGIGVSLIDSSDKETWSLVEKLNFISNGNIVIHTIVGLIGEKDIPLLKNKKVLILGYKDNVGRGVQYGKTFKGVLESNKNWLKDNLKRLSEIAQVLSFDNLALAQLDAKNVLGLSDKEWDLRFQGKDYGDPNGEDAPSTFYFDAVNQMIGRSSTQPYNERIKYTGQTFEEAFRDSLSNYTINEGEYGEIKND